MSTGYAPAGHHATRCTPRRRVRARPPAGAQTPRTAARVAAIVAASSSHAAWRPPRAAKTCVCTAAARSSAVCTQTGGRCAAWGSDGTCRRSSLSWRSSQQHARPSLLALSARLACVRAAPAREDADAGVPGRRRRRARRCSCAAGTRGRRRHASGRAKHGGSGRRRRRPAVERGAQLLPTVHRSGAAAARPVRSRVLLLRSHL
jgi:hypothetical protein